jgi:hypothetical protein
MVVITRKGPTSPTAVVAVKVLELSTGAWKNLATVDLALKGPQIDVLAHKILSWTR